MPRTDNIIVQAIEAALCERGFRRSKRYWYLSAPETVLVVNLQRAPWKGRYFVNLGVSIRQLLTVEQPAINLCQIGHRLELIVLDQQRRVLTQGSPLADGAGHTGIVEKLMDNPTSSITITEDDVKGADLDNSSRPAILRALDLEDRSMHDSLRSTTIVSAMINYGIPFLERFCSIARIRLSLSELTVTSFQISKAVYDLVGVLRPAPGVKSVH